MKRLKKPAKLLAVLMLLGANIVVALYIGKAVHQYRAPAVVTANADHEINIHGVIENLDDQTKQVNKLVRAGVGEIFIDINSPGGGLVPTEKFLRVMASAQYHGVVFTCVVTRQAASAATIILSHCNNRYALYGTGILWHSMLMQGSFRLNEQSTSKVLTFMQVKNEEIWAATRIHFWPWYFTKHFVEETMLFASEVEKNGFGFLNVIQSYNYQEGQEKKVTTKAKSKNSVKIKVTGYKCKCTPIKPEREEKKK